MKLFLDAKAVEDLEHIFDWIAAENPSAANAVISRIFASIERLALFPMIGRDGQAAGTREWVVPRLPYIVVYQADSGHDVLRVIAIFHAAQLRP